MSAKEVFDRAITLKEGETLLVPCHDHRQQESLRVALAYQRRAFLSQADTNFDIISSKVTREGKPFVAISKAPRITTGFVISKDGNISTTSLKPAPGAVDTDIIELARMKAAMKEDGYTDAQLQEHLAGKKVSINDICSLAAEPEE
jgi:hypothetical protein